VKTFAPAVLVACFLLALSPCPGQTPSISPIRGKTCSDISGDFGPRVHPVLNIVKKHEGVDFDVPVGTPVRSTASGKVMLAGPVEGYGLEVVVAHGGGFRTLYAHLSRLAVAPGAIVKKGEVIAYSGKSGLVSTAHLHYEVLRNGKNVDPKLYIHRSADQ
jgi:murein DD-endopeptidase MepM/ murein hydrolase activator NlpD